MARFGSLGTQYADDAMDPLINGLIHFFESGTSTEKTTYADINLTIANTNPVVLTAAGRQPNIFFAGSAKAILATSADVQIEVRDPVGQATSEEAFAAWNALITYDLNDIVKGSDQLFYTSIGNANIGHDPTSTSGFWMEVRFINVWDAAYTYADGLFAVASDDNLYISRIDTNIGNDPVSSPTQWRLLSAGVPNGTVDGQMIRWESATSEYQAVSDMVIDDAGDVGINIVAPESQLHVLREATSLAFFDRMGSGAGGPEIMGRRAKGTVGTPTAVQSGEELVEFKGAGHDGVAFTGGRASVTMVAAENFTPSAQGARMEFLTTPIGATADVLAMTIEENGDITADKGNFVVGVAGKGIDFSVNTPAAGMTSQLLTCYEEGLWTPTLSDGTNNATSATELGEYTRVGRMVTCWFRLVTSALGSVSGPVRVTGLPFTSKAFAVRWGNTASSGQGLAITAGTAISGFVESAATDIRLQIWDAGSGTTPLQGSEWSDNGGITLTVCYEV